MLRDKENNILEKTQLNGEYLGAALVLQRLAKLKKKYEVDSDETN